MRYIQPPWENYFFSKVLSVEKFLYLSSPYIKNTVATLLYEVLRSKQDLNLSIQILTSIRIQDLLDGASDLEAFEKLLQLEELEGINAEVRCIPNLHAKVYIFDEHSAIVTSSNLTSSGLHSNIEYGIEVTDPTAIQPMLVDMGNYWDAAETLTSETLEQVRERLEIPESVVNVDQTAQQTENRLLIENSSISIQEIGKRLAPLGQDVEDLELDNLRGAISVPTQKSEKKSRVIITHSEDSTEIADGLGSDSNSSDRKTKSSAIEIETSYGKLEENSVEQLISNLKDDDKQKRKEARKALRNTFEQAESRKISLKDQINILRRLIAAGIAPTDEMLFERLTYNSHVRFRTISIRALRQNGIKYWHRFSDMAESDSDVGIRNRAVHALADVDAAAAHKILIKLRESEPEEDLRNTISSLIQRYEESIRNLSVDEKQLLQSLASDLQSSDHKIRRKAARDLRKLKHTSVVQPLCSALKDENKDVRSKAAESLGKINDKLSVLPLIEVLENDPSFHARAAAAEALGIIGLDDKRVLEAISNGLTDENGHVQNVCRRNISKLR